MTFSQSHDILKMLAYGRPSGTGAERAFIKEFIEPFGVRTDKAGNLIKRIGTAPVLWSCHTDTVHKLPGRQTAYLSQGGLIRLAPNQPRQNCLGADDTAGVWLMREMVKANVPGLYVFHAAEEVGGKGSSYIAESTPELLSSVSVAIALDRKGHDSVITHQWSRCCSDTFAASLAGALGGHFHADETGIFTDTANYTDLIGECTNISVGYEDAHGPTESLDFLFLVHLLERLKALDVSALAISRQPGEIDRDWALFDSRPYSTLGGGWEMDEDPNVPYDRLGSADLIAMVEEYPDVAADILESMGVDSYEFESALDAAGYPKRRHLRRA